MDQTYNFEDIIKKSVLKFESFGKIDIFNICLGLMISFCIGLFIYWVYKKTFKGVVYSHNFNITLVLMTMITSLIIMTISTNIVLSLGMVGALSIVRFRTAIKDPIDIVYMFWSISIGIAVGAGIYVLAIIGSLFIAFAIFILTRRKLTETTYLLIIHHDEEATIEVKRQLRKLNYTMKSKIVRNHFTELTVEIKLKIDNTGFIHSLSSVEGVKDVSLVQYNGDYAV
ncbi:DUF4956 domain-containing protein [Peribacillus acanthi]|uniref:DUF4956 domain-containing protein n=1 Tax=Peribacillus acanthi TaxID=2171554 RepID=UPI000D3E3E47|nr:DUF4956 domain-containing protein [Peribacillus acanthi]